AGEHCRRGPARPCLSPRRWLGHPEPESHVKLTKQFAVGAGLIVVSVNYRLAPENPYRRRLTTAWPRSAGSAKTPPHSAATRRGCRSAGIALAAAWAPRLPSRCSP